MQSKNIFLTSPEVVKLFDMLVEGQVWFSAFSRMVKDFEILTDQPERNFFRRVRIVFDKWSGGNGLMPGNECANALLELTGGGLWLKAVQQLFVNMRLLAEFADGDSRDDLQSRRPRC